MKITRNATRSVALAMTAAIAGGAAVAATSSATPSPHGVSSAKTVHVIEHAITDREAPGVDGKNVKGNILTFDNPVYNTANRVKVGHDQGFCTMLAPKQNMWECQWTTYLKGGQITVQGPYFTTHNTTLSITGGTGAYRTARGEMRLNARDGGKEYDFIFRVS
jgi:allene oxide cyclase